MKELIEELALFSTEVIELKQPASEFQISEAEKKIGVYLPGDYKIFLEFHNGLNLMGKIIYGVEDGTNLYSLEKCYDFEHFEVGNPMYTYLVPFSPDGAGNHYCFDTRRYSEESCAVVFWQHDIFYNEENEPETVNSSFAEWLKEVVIDWTLEDYDYAGNSK